MQKFAPGIVNGFHDGDSIIEVARREDGEVILTRRPAEFSLFIRSEDIRRPSFVPTSAGEKPTTIFHELTSGPNSRHVRLVRHEGAFARIAFHDSVLVKEASAWLEEDLTVQTFEANVSPLRRWMVDAGVKPAAPRRVYTDVEWDSRVEFAEKTKARILCLTLIDEQTGTPRRFMLEEDTDEAELRMLEAVVDALEDYDQIVAWNGDNADFPMIKSRSRQRGILVEFRRWLWLDHLEVFKRQNAMGAESGEEKESNKLGDVARSLKLPEKKSLDASRTWEAWSTPACGRTGGEAECGCCRECLAEYNERDALIMPAIEKKTGYLELHRTLCAATGVFQDTRSVKPMGAVESFLLRLGLERGYRFRTRFPPENDDDREKFKGAHVLRPTTRGITKDVHVVDFSRLYPSIILAFNLSPEAKRERPRDGTLAMPSFLKHSPAWEKARMDFERESREIPEGQCQAATGARFDVTFTGILPLALEVALALRVEADERKTRAPAGTDEHIEANRLSSAYKIFANSFFGVVSSMMSMFFDVEIGEAITQTGKWLILETMAEAQRWGLQPIYGDTDSAFICGCTKERFVEFKDHCNKELYPRLLAERGAKPGFIKVAYEKQFERLVFSTTEKDENAAKLYAGRFAHYKGTPSNDVEIKGLAYRRGDALRLTRKFQREVVDGLMKYQCEDPMVFVDWVKVWQSRILLQPFVLSEVRHTKSLSKPLGEYKKRPKKKGIALGPATVKRTLVGAVQLTDCLWPKFFGGRGEMQVPLAELHPSTTLDPKKKGSSGEVFANDWSEQGHVTIARMLLARGLEVRQGSKISWVVIDGNVSPKRLVPAIDWDGETVDRHELWETVYGPTKRLLAGAFPGVNWDAFARTRPAKIRVKKAAVSRVTAPASQLGLFSGAVLPRA